MIQHLQEAYSKEQFIAAYNIYTIIAQDNFSLELSRFVAKNTVQWSYGKGLVVFKISREWDILIKFQEISI